MFIATLFLVELAFKFLRKIKSMCKRIPFRIRCESHPYYKSPLPGHTLMNGTSWDAIENTNLIL